MAIRNVRVSSSLSLSELLEVANDRGLLDWEHQAAQNATMGDIDREKVKVYLELRSASSRQASRFEHMEWGAQLRQVMVPFPQMQACCSLATIRKSIFCKVILRVLFRETVGASR